MKRAKDRTIQKKRVNKANKIAKTEASRRRRVANKHRREEIHAIDPDMKVVIINQTTFDQHGTEIEVMNGKIRAAKLDDEIIKATIDFCNEPADTVIEKIETRNKSAFKRLTDKLRRS